MTVGCRAKKSIEYGTVFVWTSNAFTNRIATDHRFVYIWRCVLVRCKAEIDTCQSGDRMRFEIIKITLLTTFPYLEVIFV